MTDRACFFVVHRVLGVPIGELYWDELPRAPIRNLQYVLRLDTLPNADKMLGASVAQLFLTYEFLKKRGKLPPRWEPPPAKQSSEPAKPLTGHREVHPRRHLPDAPAEPWPDPAPKGFPRETLLEMPSRTSA